MAAPRPRSSWPAAFIIGLAVNLVILGLNLSQLALPMQTELSRTVFHMTIVFAAVLGLLFGLPLVAVDHFARGCPPALVAAGAALLVAAYPLGWLEFQVVRGLLSLLAGGG